MQSRYSVDELRSSFAEADLRRGERYAREGRVLWSEQREHGAERTLLGEVRGSRRQPYRVHVRVIQRDGRWRFESHCSCPVQVACKHACALLLRLDPSIRRKPNWASAAQACVFLQPQDGQVGLLARSMSSSQPVLGVRLGQWLRKDSGSPWRFQDLAPAALTSTPDTVLAEPMQRLLPQLLRCRASHLDGLAWLLLPGTGVADLLLAADAGLMAWGQPQLLLQRSSPRADCWHWQMDARGEQRLSLDAGAGSECVRAGDHWLYVDVPGRRVGPLQSDLDAELMRELCALGPLPPARWAEFDQRYGARLPASFPRPQQLPFATIGEVLPAPILTLHQSAVAHEQRGRRSARLVAYARLSFRYGPARVGESDPSDPLAVLEQGELHLYPRDRGRERELANRLKQLGLISNRHAMIDHPGLQQHDWVINVDGDMQTLNEFCFAMLPRLRQEGWRLEYGPRFPLKLIDAEYRFYAEVDDERDDQALSLDLGIEIDGERLSLLPVLRAGLREGRFQDLPSADEAIVALMLPGERRLPITAGRLRAILQTLSELGTSGALDQRRVRLPRVRAAALLELESALSQERPLWTGAASVRRLAERLTRFAGLPATPVPAGLRAQLRPYQIEGLSWLRFLGEHGLSGILADDMGLGKTVQVLAYIIGEQEAGRLDLPVLVVCPKSVVPNWEAESARFAPSLRCYTHTGPERGKRRAGLTKADLVLTSYPVLARDIDFLVRQSWHLLVLDESQMIKNPVTLAARAARRLDARQRICLTGTPLENHLGELWAQFDVVLPGLLGSKVDFTRQFRSPIEKARSREVGAALRRRIRPFLLRRTKDQVVADLPPKTEVSRSIVMDGRQRELYEQLRDSYAEDVRGWIASGSFERNRMRALEGLLRLRQICCDPHLLRPLPEGRVPASAKLDYLMDMLHELLAAGRHILVFSQFTSMLELIEAKLLAERVRYVKLTGQTEDRATPVQRFQRGEVPLFLISLRAGGFGLNLTRADTVVHYDPWWNPAVESQATDRAHRIGQDKPVFVYRLIASDSVEERILELQARKRELADALLDESGQSLAAGLGAEDWLSLLT